MQALPLSSLENTRNGDSSENTRNGASLHSSVAVSPDSSPILLWVSLGRSVSGTHGRHLDEPLLSAVACVDGHLV
jgi:hypothetical protein